MFPLAALLFPPEGHMLKNAADQVQHNVHCSMTDSALFLLSLRFSTYLCFVDQLKLGGKWEAPQSRLRMEASSAPLSSPTFMPTGTLIYTSLSTTLTVNVSPALANQVNTLFMFNYVLF